MKYHEIFEIQVDEDSPVIPSINVNNRIYLPFQFIAEFFRYNVDYTTANNSSTGTELIEIYQGVKPELQLDTTYTKEESWRPQGVTVGTEEDWKKFYTQKHPVTGATPIPDLYYIISGPQGNVFTPIFDHTDDGIVGLSEKTDVDSNGNTILVDGTVSIAELATMSDSEKSLYSKQECIEWYKQTVINTKPTAP